jgi:hypothetical protein
VAFALSTAGVLAQTRARWAPTRVSQINAVDISNMPQQLVSRVETVTAGASAGYGSPAPTPRTS